jgi:hypothetical protein
MEENVFDISKISDFSLSQQQMIRKAVIHLFEHRNKGKEIQEIANLIKKTEAFEDFIDGEHTQQKKIIKALDVFLTTNRILSLEDLFFAYLSEVFLSEIQDFQKGGVGDKYQEDIRALGLTEEEDKKEFFKEMISEITKDYYIELNNVSKMFSSVIDEGTLKHRLSEFWDKFSSEAHVKQKYRS